MSTMQHITVQSSHGSYFIIIQRHFHQAGSSYVKVIFTILHPPIKHSSYLFSLFLYSIFCIFLHLSLPT